MGINAKERCAPGMSVTHDDRVWVSRHDTFWVSSEQCFQEGNEASGKCVKVKGAFPADAKINKSPIWGCLRLPHLPSKYVCDIHF